MVLPALLLIVWERVLCARMHTHAHARTRTHTHAHARTRTRARTHTRAQVRTHTHERARAHTHTHRQHDKPAVVFSTLLLIVWVGSVVVTVNAKLLGGSVSFFQVCVFVLNRI